MEVDYWISGSKASLVNNSEKALTLLCKLNDFRLSGVLCDVVIKDTTNNVEYSAHACVLATQSELFHGLLATESPPKSIQLEGLQADILHTCIEYLYGNVISIDTSRLDDLTNTAGLMKIHTLTKICQEITDFIKTNPGVLSADEQTDKNTRNKEVIDSAIDIKLGLSEQTSSTETLINSPVAYDNVSAEEAGDEFETDLDTVDFAADDVFTEIYLYEDSDMQPSVRKQYCTHCCMWITNRWNMKQHLRRNGFSNWPKRFTNNTIYLKPALLPDVYHEADAEVELSARRMLCTHCDEWFPNRKELNAHRKARRVDRANIKSLSSQDYTGMYREVFLVSDPDTIAKRRSKTISRMYKGVIFHEDDMHLRPSSRRVFCGHCATWISNACCLRNHRKLNGIPDPMVYDVFADDSEKKDMKAEVAFDTLQAIQDLKERKQDPALASTANVQDEKEMIAIPHQDDETHYCDHCDTFFADKTEFDKHCSKLGLTVKTEQDSENTMGAIKETSVSNKPEGQGEYSPSGDESTDTDPEIEENEQNKEKQTVSTKQRLHEVITGANAEGRLAVTLCDHCNKNFSTVANYQRHRRDLGLPFSVRYVRNEVDQFAANDTDLFCDHCNRYFSSIHNLQKHRRNLNLSVKYYPEEMKCKRPLKSELNGPTQEQSGDDDARLAPSSGTHYCDHCHMFFANKATYDQHRSKIGLSPGKTNVTMDTKETGSASMDTKKSPRHQAKVGEASRFGDIAAGRRRSYNVTPRVHSTFCDHCNRTFSSLGNLQRHRSHLNLPVVYHNENKKRETDAQVLRAIRQKKRKIWYTEDSKKLIVCSECGEQVRGEQKFKRHYTVAHEQKFKCKICGKCFPHASGLQMHESRHLNVKPFLCAYCDYRTVTKRELQLHEDLKHGKDTYLCSKCEFVTTSSIALRQHEIKHRELKCTECEFTTNIPKALRYHLRIVHDTGPVSREDITCPICGKQFQKPEYKRHHVRTVHGISLSKAGVRISMDALEAKKEDERLLKQATSRRHAAGNRPRLKRKRKAVKTDGSSDNDSDYDDGNDNYNTYEQVTTNLREVNLAGQNVVVEEITDVQQILYVDGVAHKISQDFGIHM